MPLNLLQRRPAFPVQVHFSLLSVMSCSESEVPAFILSRRSIRVRSAPGRLGKQSHFRIHSYSRSTPPYDPRAPSAPVPASTKWLNDELDDVRSLGMAYPAAPLAAEANAVHANTVAGLRGVSPQSAAQLVSSTSRCAARSGRRADRSSKDSSTGTLKPWRGIVTPHADVASGRYQQAEFAADLWQVHLGEGSDEYKKPQEFFRRTYLTASLTRLLVGGVQRIAGKGGDPVVQLQTNFGGGKPPVHAQPKRFHGTVTLDPTRVGRDSSRIAEEVIAHLVGLVGSTVTVTLEIEAAIPAGAPDASSSRVGAGPGSRHRQPGTLCLVGAEPSLIPHLSGGP